MSVRKRAATKRTRAAAGTAARGVRGRASATVVAPLAGRIPRPTPAQVAAAKRKYQAGILARREAVPKGKPLPPGATHEVVGKTRGGRAVLKRRRFSTH